jgi:MEDS: MEthanogen/methylotroph, DcmR Sensory domain
MIYTGSPVAHVHGLAQLIIRELKANKRCLYINKPTMVAAMKSSLGAAGVDVESEVKRGSLVLSSKKDHLLKGRFEVDRMLAMLTAAIDAALLDGYQGLWATGDMTWELGRDNSFEKLFAYECSLEVLFKRYPSLSGLCQYHHDTLPADSFHAALLTHQSTYINQTLSRMNPYYSRMESPVPRRMSSPRVRKMLAQAV